MGIDLSELSKKIHQLRPEQRAALEQVLKQQGIDLNRVLILPQPRAAGSFPLSYAQQRLWFLDQLEPGSPAYNLPVAVRLLGRLDIDALRWSLNEIIRRHESLRTRFVLEEEQPVQKIDPRLEIPLLVTDLITLPEMSREHEAYRLASEEARRSFDLAAGPLIRGHLYRIRENETIALLTMHHIVSDGWSMSVLMEELAQLYAARITGQDGPLTNLPIQYIDFACWQRQWLENEIQEKQLAYWEHQLADCDTVLELPTDHQRPPVQTGLGAEYNFKLPAGLLQSLKQLAIREDATLFMILLAAFEVLLYRYSRQESFTIGSPVANRTRSEVERLIGFFVNTLVHKADLSDEPSFRQLLDRVRSTALGAYENQDLPFELLAEKLHPERSLSRSPLFQVMFVLQNNPPAAFDLPGLRMELVDIHSGASSFDLTLVLSELPDGLGGVVEYSTDLFGEQTIRRMVDHLEFLLNGIIANPDEPVSRLPLMPASERKLLLETWNDTARVYPDSGLCLHERFEAQVLLRPDEIAVIQPESEFGPRREFSYSQLNCAANQIAHLLLSLGAGPEQIVGICLDRSIELIAGLLGILKSGAAYLPLDPQYPQDRLAHMIADSGAQILVTMSHLADRLPSSAARIICLDLVAADLNARPGSNPETSVTPENLAYLMYTSGSTGRPKGVQVIHRTVINHNLVVTELYEIQPGSRVLQFSTINFDAAVEEIFPTLGAGAALVLRPGSTLMTGREFTRLVVAEHISVLIFPTAYFHEWVYELSLSGERVPSSVKTVSIGGEKALAERLAMWHAMGGDRSTWINSYGPTEATIIVTSFKIPSGPPAWQPDQEIPIGKPIANARMYVLDAHRQPVPIGVPGELYIGGDVLARGYHNQPQLTQERFVPDPFSSDPASRLYRTGDLVRIRPDGNIDFLGRADQQVKIRGYRVELGEIEANLVQHPRVKDAVISTWKDQSSSLYLAAYVVSRNHAQPDPAELRAFLKNSLPEYMIPAVFINMSELPMTPGGKVNRRALPAPEGIEIKAGSEPVAPRGPVEEILVGVWQQLLGKQAVGVEDNFFDLGGHSLLATQLISRLQLIFEIDLPVRVLFENPTIVGLAKRIELEKQNGAHTLIAEITPVDRSKPLPLSFAQQRLWFLDQLEPGNSSYNIPNILHVKGELDLSVLESSFNELIRRHETLRTSFYDIDGKPYQKVEPPHPLHVELTDLSHLELEKAMAQAVEIGNQEALKPFDLTICPLFRVRVIRLSALEHMVVMVSHHIISDGWSERILQSELMTVYTAYLSGQASPLAELAIQYADFAAWQHAWMQGEVRSSQLDYWKQQLAALPPLLELPTDRPRPPAQTFNGDFLPFSLPLPLSRSLRSLSRSSGATLFMTLLAAFQLLLARYARQSDIPVGTPVANRNRGDLEPLIGFFVNTLVLRGDLSGQPSFLDLLQRTRETALAAYAHQDLPFELLVDTLQPQRNLAHSPLFQVMFVTQNAPPPAVPVTGLQLAPLDTHPGTAKFDLTLFMLEGGEALSGAFEFNTDLFDPATIARLLANFQVLLEGIVAHPDWPVWKLPLLTPHEWRQQVIDWNQTAAPFPAHLTAIDLFEAQVERSPHAPAARFLQTELSYAALNARANQLGAALQELGIGPDTLVGVCLPRSLELLTALLAVWKAGGAYVPLDPSYPPERLAYMLADAAAPLLLTHSSLLPALQPVLPPSVRLLCLDTSWEPFAAYPPTNTPRSTRPTDLAYVIYTSGSTGKPKGAMVEQRGLVNYLTWTALAYPLHEGCGAPVQSSISFDLTVTSLLAPLMTGRGVLLLDEQLGPEALGEALSAHSDFSLVKITPAHLQLLGQQVPPSAAAAKTRAFIIGGENLTADHIAFWHAHAPHTALVNEYGPTETVVGCCCYWVPPDAAPSGVIPIGRPIRNTTLYVLDEHQQVVPIGVPGELYIGGVGVGRGYLNRPELTAERFLPDPFSATPGARLYRTGDLVRYRPDGNLECLGRIDFQVKIRGFRVELGEIETVLSQHPAVKETVVWVRTEHGAKRLIAYFVPADGFAAPTPAELKAFLHQRLPDYMLPAAFVCLAALPLTPNGKLDRQALPAPEWEGSSASSAGQQPLTHAERVLAAIWERLLGVERVARSDNFFELGGDSILSIQVVSAARQAGLALSARLLFEHPVLAELAAAAGSARAVLSEQGLLTGPLPLAPIQRWFFHLPLPQPHHWNQSVLLETPAGIRPDALEKALAALVNHHDQLRARFWQAEGIWHQEITGEFTDQILETVDLSGLPAVDQVREIENRSALAQAQLDLTAGMLLKALYFELEKDQPGRLLLVVHHLVIDGVSWRIFLEDLLTAYTQSAAGKQIILPLKTTSYSAWASRLAQFAVSDQAAADLEYWSSLPAVIYPDLPLDSHSGPILYASESTVATVLSNDETAQLLRDATAFYRASVEQILLAAAARAVNRWAGARDLLVDLEHHGRSDQFEELDLTRTIGWFTSIYPVSLQIPDQPGPSSLVAAVKDQLARVPGHGFTFNLLRFAGNESQQALLKTIPPAQLSFNYLGIAGSEEGLFNFATELRGPEIGPENPRRYVIEVNAGIFGGALRMEWSFSANQLRPDTAQKIAVWAEEALREILDGMKQIEAKASAAPEDFPLANLNQAKLDKLMSKMGKSKGK